MLITQEAQGPYFRHRTQMTEAHFQHINVKMFKVSLLLPNCT